MNNQKPQITPQELGRHTTKREDMRKDKGRLGQYIRKVMRPGENRWETQWE